MVEEQASVAVRVLQSLGTIDKKAYKNEKACMECNKRLGSGLMHTKKQNW
jgi:hypothetical protein